MTDDGLRIDVISTAEDGRFLVVLNGEIDLLSARSFVRSMSELPSTPAHVVIDVSGLTFVDSSGINALVQSVRTIEQRGGSAVLAAPSAATRRVFEITRVADVVTVAGDRDEALRQARQVAETETASDDLR